MVWARRAAGAALLVSLMAAGGCNAASRGKVYRYEQASSTQDEKRRAVEAYKLAVAQIRADDPVTARQNLEAATRYDPGFGKAFNNLGALYLEAAEFYQAAWALRRAAELMPRNPTPLANLGLVMERGGRWDEAIDLHQRALALDPANPRYLARLARAKVRRGDQDSETVSLLEEVHRRGPGGDWPLWASRELKRQAEADQQRPDGATPRGVPSGS